MSNVLHNSQLDSDGVHAKTLALVLWRGRPGNLVDAQLYDRTGILRRDGDIGIHGSIKLARSLWSAAVIDELQLVIAPVVAGHGRRLFDGENNLQKLDLREDERTAGGTVFLLYRRPPTNHA